MTDTKQNMHWWPDVFKGINKKERNATHVFQIDTCEIYLHQQCILHYWFVDESEVSHTASWPHSGIFFFKCTDCIHNCLCAYPTKPKLASVSTTKSTDKVLWLQIQCSLPNKAFPGWFLSLCLQCNPALC